MGTIAQQFLSLKFQLMLVQAFIKRLCNYGTGMCSSQAFIGNMNA